MSDELDQTDGVGGKHASARQMAEKALRAQAAGDGEEADRLFAAAERIDADAVVAVLQERRDDPAASADTRPQDGGPQDGGPQDVGPQDDEEIAAMSRTIEPGADAPSRAGVSGRGSGADNQDL